MTHRREGGFTLIEIMVVLVILGGLVGVVSLNIVQVRDEADIETAKTQMANMGQAVEIYRLRHRHVPDALAVLTENDPRTGRALLPRIPRDPWNQEYEFRKHDRQTYEIRCYGRDGRSDTEDDIVHPWSQDR